MAATERNVEWNIQEIGEDEKKDFIREVNSIMDKKDEEAIIAEHVKNYFDKKYAPNWHCVVGKHFASYVTF